MRTAMSRVTVLRRCAWFMSACALSCAAVGMVAAGADDAVERGRLEKMLAEGDNGMVVAVFRRYPGQTLPFIDRYFEGGLAMIEKGGDGAEAESIKSFRTGIRFATLADEAFPGAAFSKYANAFASWSPNEQKSFREGQRLFKAGMRASTSDVAEASRLLRESMSRAKELGDLWGEAMASGALAELALKGDSPDVFAARRYAERAVELNDGLQLREDLVQSLRVLARASARGESFTPLRRAWELVADDSSFDAATKRELLDEYATTLDQIGQKALAARLRADVAKETQPSATTKDAAGAAKEPGAGESKSASDAAKH
ncbi:MAG: hypothetical protein U0572_14625 [Phycisphaerales bacterium]